MYRWRGQTLERPVKPGAEGAWGGRHARLELSGKRTEGRPACTHAAHPRPPESIAMSKQPASLRSLEHHDAFVERHIGPTEDEIARRLRVSGHDSLDAMTDAIVPGSIRSGDALDLPPPMTEVDALAKIRAIAARNT